MGDFILIAIASILFVATFVRTAFGFGEALIGVPLMALVIPVEIAAPIAVLVSILVAAIVLVSDWRHIEFGSALHLVVFTFAGIPFGLILLTQVPEVWVKVILGTVIALFSVYSLFNKRQARLKSNRFAWIFGVNAGILGGAYGVNGPPVIVYGTLRHWTPERFRATMQGYFLPTSIGIFIGYWSAGLWVSEVTRYFLLSLPAVLLAIVFGRIAGRRLSGPRFFIWVHSALIAVGIVLVLQAFLLRSDVEAEEGDVAVFENVIFSFEPVFAGFAGGGDASESGEIFVGNDFGFDETFFEIGVDDAGCFGGFHSVSKCPCADLFFAGGEIGCEPEQLISLADQAGDAGIIDSEIV